MLSDIFAFGCSPSPVPKKRRVVEDRAPPAAAPNMAESSRRTGEMGSHPTGEIPIGEPIIPPYNGSKALPFARLLHEDRIVGASP